MLADQGRNGNSSSGKTVKMPTTPHLISVLPGPRNSGRHRRPAIVKNRREGNNAPAIRIEMAMSATLAGFAKRYSAKYIQTGRSVATVLVGPYVMGSTVDPAPRTIRVYPSLHTR